MTINATPTRRAWSSAFLSALLVLGAAVTIAHYARSRAYEHERLDVLTELTTLRARMEGVINAHLLLVHGLTSVISAHPDIDQVEFSRICRGLIGTGSALHNISGAPGMVISLVHPLEQNRAALGLDYRTHPEQNAAAMRAVYMGKPVLAGPVLLAQGGIGFVARAPVFVATDDSDEPERLWGLIAAVIDSLAFYRQSGLLEAGKGLRLAISGPDGGGAEGPVFFGDPGVLQNDPARTQVTVPGGQWDLAAIPRTEWHQDADTIRVIHFIGFTAALAAGTLIFFLIRSNQALVESENGLSTLIDTIPDLVWLKDAQGVYRACNPRVEQLFGSHRSEVLGRTDRELMDREAAERQRGQDLEVMRSGKPLRHEEKIRFRTGGHEGCFEVLRTPFRDVRGAVQGVLCIARDITERKHNEDAVRSLNAELEERVRARTAELEEINEELQTFTYSVSHDLKAPLRGIDGYSQLLQEDYADRLGEEGRLFLGNIRSGVDQMNQLIEDLLAYSRMERREVNGMQLNLRDQLARALSARRMEAEKLGGRISVRVEDVDVCADPDGLALVLRNLLDNALKFHRPGQAPTIEISSNSRERSTILSIEDNGVGFDMQFHDRIFKIFQRLQRIEDYPGTGIGLAIVRKAMQRMGGRVWAESTPGEGTTFYLELPR
ncbi:ATP-binding protein [Imhoffiella purpurea]|uniref:histidine kinase n=1 Tax=Imhoffiella purpurea TaxID=1249627 RepID=W9V7P2_9GAMM|nr:ATP-binding protein [Imhoffiella purpurea]EXJ15434.1 putative two-component system sensor protein [Imhoffiella purpurea]